MLTCLGSGLIACCENDLKKLVAISTLSQLGLMIFVYSFGEVFYTFYHIVCHALFKSLLFLGCGLCIINLYGLQDARGLIKIGSHFLARVVLLGVSVTSLIGFPFMAGFYSKDSILEVSVRIGLGFIPHVVLVVCCILTGVYSIRRLYLIIKSFSLSFIQITGISSFLCFLGIGVLGLWSISLGKTLGLLLCKLERELIVV